MAKLFDKDSGGNSGTTFRDIYLHHGINLTRYSTHEAHRLLNILDTANTQIKALIAKAKGIETKAKYRRIAAEIKRISGELNRQLIGQVELDFTELAQAETEFVEKAMRTIGVTADFELPAPAKVYTAASFGNYAVDGRETFETYLKGLSENLYKTWDSNVRAGYLSGLTAQQINRAVLGSVKDMEPGQMRGLRTSLERNTRTMIASMAEEARDSTYRANSRLFSGYRYLGTLDTRTCPVCGSLDGKIFKTLEEAPKLPAHYNCRCLYLPVVKGMEEPLEGDERASMNGPVDAKTTYADWLKTQPEAVQRDILGPTRFAAYKNGTPITSFVTDGRMLTIDQLRRDGIITSKQQAIPQYTAVSEEMKGKLQEQSNTFFESLSPEQKEGVYDYSDEGYMDINNHLYGKKFYKNEQERIDGENRVKILDDVMNKSQVLEDIIVHRGTDAKNFSGWGVNETHEIKGFVSTSITKNAIKDFLVDYSKPMTLEIMVPKGTRGLYLGTNSSIDDEDEMLLDRSMRYRVLEKNDTYMKLEVVN